MEHALSKITSLTKNMRQTAYTYGPIQKHCDLVPFGGSIRESIGPFPEFILKGRFCTRSLKGLCSPCFYSRLPIHKFGKHEYDSGYETQVKYIIQHFRDLVIANQIGQVAYNFDTDKKVYGMVCTPTGSYFDSAEYPVNIRKNNLKRIIEATIEYNCEIALHIESHAEDVIKYFKDPDMEEISSLHKLHTRVLLGFESVNDDSRNAIYNKYLSLDDFSLAVSMLKANGFPVGAFVFAGLFALTDEETINDTIESLHYLKDMHVSPVLMFANTQKYTIPDVLLGIGKYKLLDPRTVYTIIKNTVELFGCDLNSDIDPWFVADPKGGPPDPNYHIFNAETSTSCSQCADRIYAAIEKLRISKDKDSFFMTEEIINHCDCANHYNDLLKTQSDLSVNNSIYNRITSCIENAENMFPYYVLRENPWVVKAELLCYGLNLSEEQKIFLSGFNPFICEKGFINAIHVLYKEKLINVVVAESFCKKSPYSLQNKNGIWYLAKDNIILDEIVFLSFPDWVFKEYEGIMVGSVVRPHSDKCISLWPSLDCKYVKEDKGCRFCGLTSVSKNQMTKLDPNFVAQLVKVALDDNPVYEINLSGGTSCSPECAIEYISKVCNEIVQVCGQVSISVECVPPDDIEYLNKLRVNGVTAIIMNLEIFDERLRRTICPGKGQISNDKFLGILEKAVNIFGIGHVSSVLIVGIQPKDDVIDACNKLIDIGVIPTLIPFKPLDNTSMEDVNTINADEYIEISKDVAARMAEKKLFIGKSSGCVACGACSLESNLMEVYL